VTKPILKARAAPELRALNRSLPMELLKAREAAMSRFRPMLREFGLTEQQWRVIRVLAEFGRLDASELARRSMLLAPSLTRILQFLEGEGLVRRLADRDDQRRAFLELSAKGERLFALVAPASESIYGELEGVFGASRMDALYALLADFYGMLEDAQK
jgi:homoprotocatechuate degradation regulator HpaR